MDLPAVRLSSIEGASLGTMGIRSTFRTRLSWVKLILAGKTIRSISAVCGQGLLFILMLYFFLFVARRRFIDGDEGFYLTAARLVLLHKVPYLDFFFQQAPLLPYVYGIWLKLFGVSWFAARDLPPS